MSESSGSSFAFNSAASQPPKAVKNGLYGPTFSVGKAAPAVAPPVTASTSLSSQSSTVTWSQPVIDAKPLPAPAVNTYVRPLKSRKSLPEEETKIAAETAAKISASLAGDHLVTLFPDVDAPFMDAEDVVKRLLPYHVFQQPPEDLQYVVGATRRSKGKGKATEENTLREEIAETRFAIQCFKRRQALEERFRRVRIKSGKRKAPDDVAYFSTQALLEQERAENNTLTAKLRSARSELDKAEREKRLLSMPPRTSYYQTQTAQNTPYIHHYRPYPYSYTPTYTHQPYTQQYGATSAPAPVYTPAPPAAAPTSAPAAAQPAGASSTTASTSSTSATPAASTGPVPVQLPVSSLPDLLRIGITPIPITSVNSESPPAAILKDYNGGIAYLDVNVGLLQPAQMSGLAILLNTLMARGASAQSTPTSAPASAPATPVESAPTANAVTATTDAGGTSSQT